MAKNNFNLAQLANNYGCFNLQFRKDTRHERTNSPTYYRWKAQFIITLPKENAKTLDKVKKALDCGDITLSSNQARFSVQKISDIAKTVVPFFRKNCLANNKKKDFELWAKGVEVIQRNKGKFLAGWKKNDLCTLIEIQKSSAKYKIRTRVPKWLEMAKSLTKTS